MRHSKSEPRTGGGGVVYEGGGAMDDSKRRNTGEGVAHRAKIEFAREQRREPTPGECRLWEALRRGRLGVRFRRQHPIGKFVLDFYCAEVRLAVEVDGAVHDGQMQYDAWREDQLRSRGIRVLRLKEGQVHRDLPSCLTAIRRAIDEVRRDEAL